MFTWSMNQFNGERILFEDSQADLDNQLRMKNVYMIANGTELLHVVPPDIAVNATAKIQEKRNEFEHRNQIGFGIIFMSLNRKMLYQINYLPAHGCRKAYNSKIWWRCLF